MSLLAQRTKRFLIKHCATKTIRGANGKSRTWWRRLNGMLCFFYVRELWRFRWIRLLVGCAVDVVSSRAVRSPRSLVWTVPQVAWLHTDIRIPSFKVYVIIIWSVSTCNGTRRTSSLYAELVIGFCRPSSIIHGLRICVSKVYCNIPQSFASGVFLEISHSKFCVTVWCQHAFHMFGPSSPS